MLAGVRGRRVKGRVQLDRGVFGGRRRREAENKK